MDRLRGSVFRSWHRTHIPRIGEWVPRRQLFASLRVTFVPGTVRTSLDSPLDLYVDHRAANIEARVQMVIDRERDRAPVVLEVSPKR